MANTRAEIGDQTTLDGLVSRTLTEFTEDGVRTLAIPLGLYYTELKHITLPNVTTITKSQSFQYSGLLEILEESLPNLQAVPANCFNYCDNLTKLIFSNKTVSASNSAFMHDPKLDTVVFKSNTVLSTNDGKPFYDTAISKECGYIYVPDDLVDDYLNITKWSYYNVKGLSQYPITDFGSITDDWNDIIEAEKDGTFLSKYSIGDTKSIKFGDLPVLMEIVAFDKDLLSDNSGVAHITWLSKYPAFTRRYGPSVVNGWVQSEIRGYLRSQLALCQEDLLDAIKEVKKTYYCANPSSTQGTFTTFDTVFIPSAKELGLTGSFVETDGVIYSDKFTDNSSRKKFSGLDSTSTAAKYYTRSTTYSKSSSADSEVGVSESGAASSVSPTSSSYTIVFGFCT